MQFVNSRPDVVRSINQRWLLSYWDRLRGSGELPIWLSPEGAFDNRDILKSSPKHRLSPSAPRSNID